MSTSSSNSLIMFIVRCLNICMNSLNCWVFAVVSSNAAGDRTCHTCGWEHIYGYGEYVYSVYGGFFHPRVKIHCACQRPPTVPDRSVLEAQYDSGHSFEKDIMRLGWWNRYKREVTISGKQIPNRAASNSLTLQRSRIHRLKLAHAAPLPERYPRPRGSREYVLLIPGLRIFLFLDGRCQGLPIKRNCGRCNRGDRLVFEVFRRLAAGYSGKKLGTGGYYH